MTSIRDQLRSNFPLIIGRTEPVFQALIANENGTGTIERVLTELSEYMAEWKDSNNVYEQSDTLLEKSTALFTYLEPFTNESEDAFKKRVRALFVRGETSKWGTPYNILATFKEYFSLANVFLVENVDEEDNNLLENGEFDDIESDPWTLAGCSYSADARFSKSTGVLFSANGTCSQELDIDADENYYLHFFHVGDISVKVTGNTGRYWNGSEWQDEETQTLLTQTEWNDSQFFIHTDSDITGITITLIGAEGSLLDFARLFKYVNYPTFRIIVQNEGSTGKNSLALAPGSADPTEKIGDYTLPGYFEQDYMTGVASGFATDIYNDLLDYLKAEGVKAYLQTVTKDVVE